MSVFYRKEDNVNGALHSAATSLSEVLEPNEQNLNIFLFAFSGQLALVKGFTDSDVKLIKGMNGLAIYFFSEDLDVDTFMDLSPIQKYFVQGVEDQLARRVLYVGGIVGDEYTWFSVPPQIPDRWPAATTPDDISHTIQERLNQIVEGGQASQPDTQIEGESI